MWPCSPSAAAIPAGRARRTRSTRWSGWRPGRASRPGRRGSAPGGRAGTSSARRSPPITWGRVRRAGGGSDLIFPHHEMSASHARVALRGGRVRTAVRARRHGPAGRREDVQVPRQPGLRVRAAGRRRTTRWRSGWRSWRTTTAATGTGPRRGWPRRRSGWTAGGGAGGRGVAPRPRPEYTRPAPRRARRAGRGARAARRRPGRARRAGRVDGWADAVLAGPVLAGGSGAATWSGTPWMRCSASRC